MILHEIYFAGLGGASRPGARLSQAIERDFGSHARWAAEFTGMGKALAEAYPAAREVFAQVDDALGEIAGLAWGGNHGRN